MGGIVEAAAGSAAAEGTKILLPLFLDSIHIEFKARRHPDLGHLKQICTFLSSFHPSGKRFGDTFDYPPLNKKGSWRKRRRTIDEIFEEWFGGKPHSSIAPVLEQYSKSSDDPKVEEWYSSRNVVVFRHDHSDTHRTIKKMYPFIMLYVAPINTNEDDPVRSNVESFVEGWHAFVDDNTGFARGVAVILENQAYIEGQFDFVGITYKFDDELKDAPLGLRRSMIVSKHGNKLHICMTGVPYLLSNDGDDHHRFVKRWLTKVQLRN